MPNLFFLYKANRLHLLYPIYHIFNSLPIVGTPINNIYFFSSQYEVRIFFKGRVTNTFPMSNAITLSVAFREESLLHNGINTTTVQTLQ